MKKRDYGYINPMNLYRMIEGHKYQYLGLYPNQKDLQLDLERIHLKYGFILKFEPSGFDTIKVWRRRK